MYELLSALIGLGVFGGIVLMAGAIAEVAETYLTGEHSRTVDVGLSRLRQASNFDGHA